MRLFLRAIVSSSLAVLKVNKGSPSSAMMSSKECHKKMRILCLHGKFQSGSIFSNKISGARRKLSRVYDLHFLDGPIPLSSFSTSGNDNNNTNGQASAGEQGGAVSDVSDDPKYFGWWLKDERSKEHIMVPNAFDYVQRFQISNVTDQNNNNNNKQIQQQPSRDELDLSLDKFDAIIGFSQGGTLATALALSGLLPNIRAVVTAGAPNVDKAFDVATEFATKQAETKSLITSVSDSKSQDDNIAVAETIIQNGRNIPKLHFAGQNDTMVSIESTQELSKRGGNGQVIVHEQGHLFPTRAARVNAMMEFLEKALNPIETKEKN